MTDFPGDPFAAPRQQRPELIRNGRYWLPPVNDPTGKAIGRSRVTTFVKTVSDMYTLSRWHQREVVIGLAMREDLYDLSRTVDVNDRDAVQDIGDRAMEAAKSGRIGLSYGSGGNETGTALHSHTDQLDRGMHVTARRVWAPKLENYQAALRDVCLEVVPGMIECRVVIERYNLAGTFDRVLDFAEPSTGNNPLFIGDLKTQRVFYTWWEIAMQLALYAHADAMWNTEECRYMEMPKVNRDIGIVAHMPMKHEGDDPDRVQLYAVNIAEGWEACQLVERVRDLRKEGKNWGRPLAISDLASPFDAIESYAARLNSAESRDDVNVIYFEMNKLFHGQLPGELTDLGSKRWKELETPEAVETS